MSVTKDRLKSEWIEALKGKDKKRSQVLQMMQAAIKQVEVDNREEELDEVQIIDIIAKYSKKVKDSLSGAKSAGRAEMVEDCEYELRIIQAYLPEDLTDEELETIIQGVITKLEAKSMKDMGRVMKSAVPKCGNRAEGNRVSELVKMLLTKK
jgi:uncharacterized protein